MRLRGCQQVLQNINCDWLDKMIVEPGFEGALTIAFPTPSTQGREKDVLPLRKHTNTARRFVTVHAGHPNVNKYQIGLELSDRCKCRLSLVGDTNFHAQALQEHSQTVYNGPIVVHDQNSTRQARHSCGVSIAFVVARNSSADRKTHEELASSVAAFAASLNLAAMHLHETAHQSSAETEPTLRAAVISARLSEEVENPGEHPR